MRLNETELKVLPLLATPDELHDEGAALVPFPASAITATRPNEATPDQNEPTPGLTATSKRKIE